MKTLEDYGIDEAKFGTNQMKEIKEGLKNNVDVSIYANSTFNSEQMKQIRKGLENGVDASIYADNIFSC